MDQQIYNRLVSFIWSIANDCLVDIYEVGDYRKVILPMMVIRRFDAVLVPTKAKVTAMRQRFEAAGMTDFDDALCHEAGFAFCNSSPFTLTDLRSRTNQQQLEQDFRLYLDGFSTNVQDIINRFKFRAQIETLSEHDVLGLLIERFTDPTINLSNQPVLDDDGNEILPALDNHTMGTAFEEVIRRFNEETNVTDAGRHFTPRDVVRLMAELAFVPVADKIQDTTYLIYDGTCGTGGMLTVGEERMRELADAAHKNISVHLYGQENADETYAIAKADMLLKGEEADHIAYGSTISDDRFAGKTFDFCLSNPPFGTPWKKDLAAWGIKDKKEITDSRFVMEYDGEPCSMVPDVGDPQMLFLANNVSKMKTDTALGGRIVEVHNGSSLFNGKAGSGASNLRRYIIEQDLLEAIVALPENMFYNTGIGTFLWIVTNRKAPERRGKIQLIDATKLKKPLRKNIGQKNCEITRSCREQILALYQAFDKANPKVSKVFPNEEFGYWSVEVARPTCLRVHADEEHLAALHDTALANLARVAFGKNKENAVDFSGFVMDVKETAKVQGVKFTKKMETSLRDCLTESDAKAAPVVSRFVKKPFGGERDLMFGRYSWIEDGVCLEYEADSSRKETEQIPLTYPGGIMAFWENEIVPYTTDAWIVKKSIKIGYELSFTKYFYEPVKLRPLADIDKDILATKQEMAGLLDEIVGEGGR